MTARLHAYKNKIVCKDKECIWCPFCALDKNILSFVKASLKLFSTEKFCIRETLNLLTCANSSTNTKIPKMLEKFTFFVFHISCVTFHLSPVTCHRSPVNCHLSPVTCHLSPVTNTNIHSNIPVVDRIAKFLHFITLLSILVQRCMVVLGCSWFVVIS